MSQRKRTVRCSECPVNEYCPKCWEAYKERQKEKTRDRRAKGLCIWCGKPAVASRVSTVGAYCKDHKTKRHVWGKTYRVRAGVTAEPDPLQGTHVQNRNA